MSNVELFVSWRRKRFLTILVISISLLFLVFFTHLSLGYRTMNPLNVLFFGVMQLAAGNLGIEGYRILRVLTAVVVGTALAFSGYLMQLSTKNPLADPYILGVSSGALFAVSLTLSLAGYVTHPLMIGVRTLTAFSGGLTAYLITLFVASRAGMTPTSLVLAGVAVGTFFYSASLLPQYFISRDIHKLIAWSMGSFVSPSESVLVLMVFMLFLTACYVFRVRYPLNNLQISDDFVRQLGKDPVRLRRYSTLLASLITSITVAWFGVIGFVGLAAPHISRRILKSSDVNFVLPVSVILGSLLLTTSDLLSKVLITGVEIPVNVIASMIGAPVLALAIVELRKYGS
ncbi:MAG: iron ABC transporter permease [Desulfurococcaceae archaeon TW002]